MRKAVWLIVLSSLFLFSCRKPAKEGDIQSAEDQLMAENEFLRIYELLEDVAERAVFNGNTQGSFLPAAARLSFSDSSFTDGSPVVFTIDFGAMDSLHPAGLICTDGKYRAGKIRASISAPIAQRGSLISLSISEADEYYSGNGQQMNQYWAEGVIERKDSITLRLQLSDAGLRHALGSVRWNADMMISKISDAGTGWWNESYEVRGSSYGLNANGSEFEVEITSPLVRKFNTGCYQTFVQGSWMLKDARGNILIADYDPFGDVACDKIVRIQWNTFSRQINLW